MNLTKTGDDKVTIGYYQEILYRKLERGEDAIIRAMCFSGAKKGKIKSVGFEKFQILEGDGELTSVSFDELLDIQ